MKKYVIDENAKEKLIETEDYTREELKELIYGTVYDANVDALSEEDIDFETYKRQIGLYVNDYARTYFSDVLSEEELNEIIDGVEEELIEITREAQL